MFTFWIIVAGIVYLILLGWVMLFFAAVSRMNRRWERAFRDAQADTVETWRWDRAA